MSPKKITQQTILNLLNDFEINFIYTHTYHFSFIFFFIILTNLVTFWKLNYLSSAPRTIIENSFPKSYPAKQNLAPIPFPVLPIISSNKRIFELFKEWYCYLLKIYFKNIFKLTHFINFFRSHIVEVDLPSPVTSTI